MKVLHVYRTYFPDPPGGLQEAIRQICLSTQAFGVENTIFTLSPDPNPSVIKRPEATVVRCRSWAAPASCDLGGLKAFQTFRRLAREADVVHYLFPWPFADLLLKWSGGETPAVLTYISDVVRQRWLGTVYSPLMWRTLNAMQAIVANAPAYAQTSPVLSNAAIAERVRLIPLAIDECSYPSAGDDSVLDRLGLVSGETFFLFIGVLRYYKGLHTLIKAAASLRTKVVIAGSGPEGTTLKALAEHLSANRVMFAGQVSDTEKIALLKQCRALVLPSHLRSEAYGMVLVEASMFGKPMISCEIGTGTSFINADGETGIVVAPDDPTALADAMTRLQDEALASRYGAAARQRYETMFSGTALGRAYADLYKEVSGK
jgi:rhamnosyl/mannosyltransferase